jgi:hypothetical protein
VVHVTPSTAITVAHIAATASIEQTAVPTADDAVFTTKITVTNIGSIAVWDESIVVACPQCTVSQQTISIGDLYPYQSKTVEVPFQPASLGIIQQIGLTVSFHNTSIQTTQVTVPSFLPTARKFAVPAALVVGGFLLLLFILRKKHD